jgi:hypothetical protein
MARKARFRFKGKLMGRNAFLKTGEISFLFRKFGHFKIMHSIIGAILNKEIKNNDRVHEKDVKYWTLGVKFDKKFWDEERVVKNVVHVENEFARLKQYDTYEKKMDKVRKNISDYTAGGFLFGIAAGTPSIFCLVWDREHWKENTKAITVVDYKDWAYEEKQRYYKFFDDLDEFQEWHVNQEEWAHNLRTSGDNSHHGWGIWEGEKGRDRRENWIKKLQDFPLCGLKEEDINDP